MTNPTSDLAPLVARLERLERQSRWVRWSTLVALAMVASLGLRVYSHSTSVEAQRFVVRDARGDVRAELGILKHPVDGSEQIGLVVGRKKDALPETRTQGIISLALEEGAPILAFHNPGDIGDLVLRAGPAGNVVGLELFGAKSGLDLHIRGGSSRLELHGQTGTAWLGVPEHGKPDLTLKER